MAGALGDVSDDQVWRILRRRGIQLQRRRSWCITADPEFGSKAADAVGLYLNPPENAVALSVDKKPQKSDQWLQLLLQTNGTTTWFAALDVLMKPLTTSGRESASFWIS